MHKFKAHIRRSTDNQFYSVLVGRNGEVVFTSETKKRKHDVKRIIKSWFPDCVIVDNAISFEAFIKTL